LSSAMAASRKWVKLTSMASFSPSSNLSMVYYFLFLWLHFFS
jgi:hypothetical protein